MKRYVHLAFWANVFVLKLKLFWFALQVAYRKLLVARGTMRNEFINLIDRYLFSLVYLQRIVEGTVNLSGCHKSLQLVEILQLALT
jgi:hypothetical protein